MNFKQNTGGVTGISFCKGKLCVIQDPSYNILVHKHNHTFVLKVLQHNMGQTYFICL